jgi:hypothetical protein
MASIRELDSGRFQATVLLSNGRRKTLSFDTRQQAEDWGTEEEERRDANRERDMVLSVKAAMAAEMLRQEVEAHLRHDSERERRPRPRAVIAVRGDVEAQQRQVDACSAYAELKGWEARRVTPIQGSALDVDGLLEDGGVDILLIHSFSRLGRNLDEVLPVVAKLHAAGVDVQAVR